MNQSPIEDDSNEEFHDCQEGPETISSDIEKTTNIPETVFQQFENIKLNESEQQTAPKKSPNQQEEETSKGYKVEEEPATEDAEEVEDVDTTLVTPKDISKAIEAKEQGNEYFRVKDYDNAIHYYSLAIEYCPTEEEYKEQLATYYGNRSAAYFAEEEYELVIEDCSFAITLKEDYLKVIARRMQCYEKLEKYEEALTDAKKVQQLDSTYPKINIIIARMERLHNEKMEKLKDEAMGKLKELGNSILGNFGMSLDNFKMSQDPNTGSWSVGYGGNK